MVDGLSLSVSLALLASSPETLGPTGVIRSQHDLSSSCHAVGQFLFLRSPDNRYKTVGQLKEAFRGDDGFVLTSKIVCCVKAVWVLSRIGNGRAKRFWQIMP